MKPAVLSEAWVHRLQTFRRLWVGYSGGLDSTVLLHALSEEPLLSSQVHAIHVHHGLSPNATEWSKHCALFCEQRKIPYHIHCVNLDGTQNIEERARQARWRVFSSHLRSDDDVLLLAHHQDDQAETLLLHLCRGAGINGLAGMKAIRADLSGEVMRPLLNISRATLQHYANLYQLSWIEDESNRDETFSRNYIRRQIIPLLQHRWPAVVSSMSRSAIHCQQARDNLNDLAYLDCPDLVHKKSQLVMLPWCELNDARVLNILSVWLTQQTGRAPSSVILKQILDEVMRAQCDKTPCVRWGEWQVRRYRQTLYLITSFMKLSPSPWFSFPEPIYLDTATFTATPARRGIMVPNGASVHIGFRLGGESIVWRGKTRTLKTLFQTWGVPSWLRDQIPLIYVNQVLIAVLDFCVSDGYDGDNPKLNQPVYHIQYHQKGDCDEADSV
jgi:tRNA(Ile)-lysidine synthase